MRYTMVIMIATLILFTVVTIIPTESCKAQENERPAVDIITPHDGAEISGVVYISGRLYDDLVDIYPSCPLVEIRIGDGPWLTTNRTSVDDWYYFWNVTNVPIGEYHIYARAFDGTNYSVIIYRTYYVVARIGGVVMTKHKLLAASVNLWGTAFDGTKVNYLTDTDALGMFTITWGMPGIYNLTISSEGYKSQTITNLNLSTGKIWCEDGYYAGHTLPYSFVLTEEEVEKENPPWSAYLIVVVSFALLIAAALYEFRLIRKEKGGKK